MTNVLPSASLRQWLRRGAVAATSPATRGATGDTAPRAQNLRTLSLLHPAPRRGCHLFPRGLCRIRVIHGSGHNRGRSLRSVTRTNHSCSSSLTRGASHGAVRHGQTQYWITGNRAMGNQAPKYSVWPCHRWRASATLNSCKSGKALPSGSVTHPTDTASIVGIIHDRACG